MFASLSFQFTFPRHLGITQNSKCPPFAFMHAFILFKAFESPSGAGGFRMQPIIGTEITVWNDVRFADISSFITWSTLLLWSEGLPFTIPMPQNVHRGDFSVRTRNPLFFTGPYFLSKGEHEPVDNAMMKSRFQLFELDCPIPANRRKEIPSCAKCFAEWVTEYGM